jgi:hypothetical protein
MTKYKLYQYCHIQKQVVPVEDVCRTGSGQKAAHYIITDEMNPVRNPLNPKQIFTSKRKLREAYRAAGAVEIGDAYERGYNPEKGTEMREKQLVSNFMQQVRERLNG